MSSLHHEPSWWVRAHRDQFTALATTHLDRMRASKFGAPDERVAVGQMGETAHARIVRAARAKLAQGFRFMAGD